MIFYWLIKNVSSFDHNIIFFLFLQSEDNIVSNLFVVLRCLQIIKQKALLLLESLDQLSNLNIDLVFLLIFFIDIYSS